MRCLGLGKGGVSVHVRAIVLMHWFRRLRIRWEIRDDIHQAFITLGCAVICWRRLTVPLRFQSEVR
jgi:hypothetical protein